MLLGIPPDFLFQCFIFGSFTGYLSYYLTSLIESSVAPDTRPYGLVVYFALFWFAKWVVEISVFSGGSVIYGWIITSIFIAFFVAGMIMRGNSNSLLERFIFFGCALLMSPILALSGYILLHLLSSTTGLAMPVEDMDMSRYMVAYMTITVISIFSSPLIEHLFRFAKSMRPKPN